LIVDIGYSSLIRILHPAFRIRMWGIRLFDAILAATTGVLLTASFPRIGWEFLAWIAFVPLFYSIKDAPPRASFSLGFLAGLVHYTTLLYWIASVIHHYGRLPGVLCAVILMLLVIYLSLYPALFAMVISQLRARSLPCYLAAPFFWTALEYVKSFFLSGFPWENLGHSQYDRLHLIQVSDILGVYGLTALIMAVNAVLFEAWISISKNRVFVWRPILTVALVIAVLLTYGTWRIGKIDAAAEAAPKRAIALVQGNIEQAQKWLPSFQHETLKRYGTLSSAASKTGPDLIIWPETALPFYFLHHEDLTRESLEIVRTCGAYFVLGSPSFRKTGQEIRFYNSAYLVDPFGKAVGKYDKVHLVPYGEYVPLKRYFPFLGKMVEAVGDFEAGRKGQVLLWGGVKIGVLICFEAIFPELSRSMVQNGAQLLINITNDAWFGKSSAPYQHLSMVVFRAVENHVPVARAANTGISAFVDPVGRLLDETPLFEQATRTRLLPVMNHKSFYARHGDIFAVGCTLISLVVCIGSFRSRRFR
jgi:apolipoprotein N-acyltransferase